MSLHFFLSCSSSCGAGARPDLSARVAQGAAFLSRRILFVFRACAIDNIVVVFFVVFGSFLAESFSISPHALSIVALTRIMREGFFLSFVCVFFWQVETFSKLNGVRNRLV